LNFFEDANLRCARMRLKSDIMDDLIL